MDRIQVCRISLLTTGSGFIHREHGIKASKESMMVSLSLSRSLEPATDRQTKDRRFSDQVVARWGVWER